jgi:hypothetical protein
MFGIFNKPRKQEAGFSGLGKSTNAEAFMSSLLAQLVRSQTALIRIRKSDGLLKAQTVLGESIESGYTQVANCLKVCSMLNPVQYNNPVRGSFEFQCLDAEEKVIAVMVDIHFDDREPDPYFEVKISKKEA